MDYAESLKQHNDGDLDGWLYAAHQQLDYWEREAAKRPLTQAEKDFVALETEHKAALIAEVKRRGRALNPLYLPPEEKPKRRLP